MIETNKLNKIYIILLVLVSMVLFSNPVDAKTTKTTNTYYADKKLKAKKIYTYNDANVIEKIVEYTYTNKGKAYGVNVTTNDSKGKRRTYKKYRVVKNKNVKHKNYYYYDIFNKTKNNPTLDKAFLINYFDKKGNFVSSRYATKQASQKAIVALAKKQVGKAYKSGGNTPAGFDCSGLTSYTYRKTTSKNIGRASYDQVDKGTYVKMNVKNLQAGDILFWGSKSNPYHVAIYIGNGKYIHSSTPATGVEYNNINKYKPSFAKRML